VKDDFLRIAKSQLQWLCDSCKYQNKEINQSETCITWGKIKDLKKIKKSFDSAYRKILR